MNATPNFSSPVPSFPPPGRRQRLRLSALDVIQASIQPLERFPDPDLGKFLSELQQANNVRAVIKLYDTFAASAKAFQEADNSPRSNGAEDCLEAHSEHAWAKAYLCADTLKKMKPTRHDAECFAETLFSAAIQMGNDLQKAVAVVNEITAMPSIQKAPG